MPSRIDSFVSKTAGEARSAKARIEGLEGVFRMLSKQHGEAMALVERVQADPSKRAELWPRIRAELTSHEQAEVRALYPALRAYDALRPLVERHDAEAQELSALIQRIGALNLGADEWGPLFDQLADKLERHVALEEDEIFPTSQDAIGKDRARELEQPVLAAKKQIMQSA